MKFNIQSIDIDIFECDSLLKRIKGFMFVKKKITYGLAFKKCNAIHTFFMYQPIDIIMTDINDKIIYTHKGLKPNKIILPKKSVRYTYELPIGSIDKIIK